MGQRLNSFLSAMLVGLASASFPANAGVVYSFLGVAGGGGTSARFEFTVTTDEFITTPSLFSPTTASCSVLSPVIETCSLGDEVSFSPSTFFPDSIGFSAFLKPFNSDFSVSQDFGAGFGIPPGVEIFETPGSYLASSLFNLAAATLQVSVFEGPTPPPGAVAEPATWLLLLCGLILTSGAVRQVRFAQVPQVDA